MSNMKNARQRSRPGRSPVSNTSSNPSSDGVVYTNNAGGGGGARSKNAIAANIFRGKIMKLVLIISVLGLFGSVTFLPMFMVHNGVMNFDASGEVLSPGSFSKEGMGEWKEDLEKWEKDQEHKFENGIKKWEGDFEKHMDEWGKDQEKKIEKLIDSHLKQIRGGGGKDPEEGDDPEEGVLDGKLKKELELEVENAVDGLEETMEEKLKKWGKDQVKEMDKKIKINVAAAAEPLQRNLPTELARGVSGLPLAETPALIGGSRGHIECSEDVDHLAYWNQPQGKRDQEFKSPFIGKDTGKEKYLSFEPDIGGWNNIRMNLEIIFVIAAATGRTLVLPPDNPIYLLWNDKGLNSRGMGDFYPLHKDWFQKRLKVISFDEFIQKEGGKDGQVPIPEHLEKQTRSFSKVCERRHKSTITCDPIFEYLFTSGYVPVVNMTSCIIFDEDAFNGRPMPKETQQKVDEFCKPTKFNFVYNSTMQEQPLIHFSAEYNVYRLLAHFYGVMTFTDPAIDNHFKRFVRDFMHYRDDIYCAAGKIVNALQKEGTQRGFALDKEGGGGFASMHVRRGDLQYKESKISAEQWIASLNDTWKENEIIYIATDERNKTFFDPLLKGHELRFLDDYWDMANLGDLDPNYMGMIETIVASRGRTFGGTFFSTFSGYINRMRGYHGMSMKDSYYGWIDRKKITHTWQKENLGMKGSYEWPTGWIGIDGDKPQSRETF